MTENPRLRLILELFHRARRDKQIVDKLEARLEEYRDSLGEIGVSLCMYSPWKKKDILIRIKDNVRCLCMVTEVYFCAPSIEDMKPLFDYYIETIVGLTSDGEYELSRTYRRLYGKDSEIRQYRLASLDEIAELKKALPVKKLKKGIKK